MDTPRAKPLTALMMVIVTIFVMGCSFLTPEEQAQTEQAVRDTWAEGKEEAKLEEYKAEPDQVLASGDVLSTRVNYGASEASQCQVRIDNERNGWYDEVEIWVDSGDPLGSTVKPYDDYRFGSTNFNKQITNPNNAPTYTPEAVKGEYTITVTANDGYSTTVKVNWDGEKFSPSLLSFSLD